MNYTLGRCGGFGDPNTCLSTTFVWAIQKRNITIVEVTHIVTVMKWRQLFYRNNEVLTVTDSMGCLCEATIVDT